MMHYLFFPLKNLESVHIQVAVWAESRRIRLTQQRERVQRLSDHDGRQALLLPVDVDRVGIILDEEVVDCGRQTACWSP